VDANKEERPRLYGRLGECETLAALIDGVRRGHGAVLVVRGEAGVGKTALLDYGAELAKDLRIIRATGAEAESGLAYAGLHQLCGPLLGLLDRLPSPQRAAIETVFGMHEGSVPNRFLLGLGILGLFTEAAAADALVCVLDDVQWLDQASKQTLAFAARRLSNRSVLMMVATREPVRELAGVPELLLSGLRDADARELLSVEVRWPLDERVRDQIVAETRGNPRMLLDVRDLSPTQLAGGLRLPEAPLSGISGHLLGQFGGLPTQTRTLLLAAAADPTGDPALLWRAAGQLGITIEAVVPAVEADLATFTSRVHFRDLHARWAAYQSAPLRDRQAAHLALAQVTDPQADPDRRAWHLAQACSQPDADIAAELERTATQAQVRGGLAASAAFLERAAVMTPDANLQTERSLAAAEAMLQAGEPGAVARLLAVAEAEPPGDRWQVRADLARARLAFAQQRSGDVPRLLLDAVDRLAPADAAEARAACLHAFQAVTFAGELATPGGTVADLARATRAVPRADSAGAPDLLLDGLADYLNGEWAAGAQRLRQALNCLDRDVAAGQELRWLPLARTVALHLWDDQAWDRLSSRHVQLARDAGALGDLPLALDSLAVLRALGGELNTAEALVQEAQAIAATTGSRPTQYGTISLAALRGRQAALPLLVGAAEDAAAHGEGLGAAAAKWAAAMLHNGLGQYETALATAEDALRYMGPLTLAGWPAAELVEAAARAGQPARAADAMRYLSRIAAATGSDWARGVRARSLALLSDADSAEELYQSAVEHLSQVRAKADLARAHLLYGEWLRREKRRVDAREQLHAAHLSFAAMGAEAFAERARRELLATGETVRKRTAEVDRELTTQELEIALRARDGLTNTEIGAELFLSPRTVEWHLRKVFVKLDITSRRQLQRAMPAIAASDS